MDPFRDPGLQFFIQLGRSSQLSPINSTLVLKLVEVSFYFVQPQNPNGCRNILKLNQLSE